jgi:beta-N-acetylhexosaminidase
MRPSLAASHVKFFFALMLGTMSAAFLPSLTQTLLAASAPRQQVTPKQHVDRLVRSMTLDRKLGQMMIVQFQGPTYSADIATMIGQYGVGAVVLYTINGNIQDKSQLKGLIAQMQESSALPLLVAIDQEGGYVDRLAKLNGKRPSVATIAAGNNPAMATAAGLRDAVDLMSYGFNLNLAPVVDVTNAPNPQLYRRTWGDNPEIVTKMAAAYLQGLQQNGRVFGTLKHFPGLGNVEIDPHRGVPDVRRSRPMLEDIDWVPYRALITRGDVHAVMVTHEVVRAVDPDMPSTLSHKLLTGVLREQFGFHRVVMTDSLTMEGITAFYPPPRSAALAVAAGNDLLMGAKTPEEVAAMTAGIKQAIESQAISVSRIDESVRRILTMKFELGLLPVPRGPPQ